MVTGLSESSTDDIFDWLWIAINNNADGILCALPAALLFWEI